MSACSVLSPERLERALRRELEGEERTLVSTHLATPCEACLELLASVDGERLLRTLAGPAAELSPAEADRMFAAVARPAAGGFRAWLRALFRAPAWRPALAVAAVLVLAVPAVSYWYAHRSDAAWTGLKGRGGAPEVTLQAFVGELERPDDVRRFADGERLGAREFLLFRYRLGAPAYLYLVRRETGEVLFGPDPGEGPTPVGEAEITGGGRALALEGRRLLQGGTLVLLAAPTPLAPAEIARAAREPPTPGSDVVRVGPP